MKKPIFYILSLILVSQSGLANISDSEPTLAEVLADIKNLKQELSTANEKLAHLENVEMELDEMKKKLDKLVRNFQLKEKN